MVELQFQEAQEQYRRDHNVASILAAIANTIPSKSRRTYKAKDFIGQEPQREKEKTLKELAEEKGIKLPKGGWYECIKHTGKENN